MAPNRNNQAHGYQNVQDWIRKLYRRAAIMLFAYQASLAAVTWVSPHKVWGSEVWRPLTDFATPYWAAVWLTFLAAITLSGLIRWSRSVIDVSIRLTAGTWALWSIALGWGIIADGLYASTGVFSYVSASLIFWYVISPLTAGPPCPHE